MRNLILSTALAALAFTVPAGAQQRAVQAPSAQAALPATAATYTIDPVHSELSFRIRHLLGRVAGTFGEWNGTVVMDTANIAASRVDVSVKTASIDTRVAPRDEHLRSSDFFAADSFPTITFRSTKVTMAGTQVRIEGNLTIRGRTKPVTLSGTFEGRFQDPWGKERVAFLATTTIDRHDFGVSFDGPFETIGQIGDEVAISIAIEAVKNGKE